MSEQDSLQSLRTYLIDEAGRNLVSESQQQKIMIILVRHAGCTFCRESLQKLGENLSLFQRRGIKPVVVHMGDASSAASLKSQYALQGVDFISDPDRHIYQALGARRGNLLELFGPQVVIRGFVAGVLEGHGVGKLQGDGFQLAGSYLLSQEKIFPIHIPKNAGDIEDWPQILAQDLP